MRRTQNKVTVTLDGAFANSLTPRTIPLKQDTLTNRQHKELRNSSWGDLMQEN